MISIKLTSDVPCVHERHKKKTITHFTAETMSPEIKFIKQNYSVRNIFIFTLRNTFKSLKNI